MPAYDEAVDACVEAFDRFHHCIRETNRRMERLQAAEVDFLNAVDEQHAAYEDAIGKFHLKAMLENQAEGQMAP